MASQTPSWPNWQAHPPPPPPAAFPGHGTSFRFPPSPHPMAHDAADDSTDEVVSDTESYDSSEGEADEGVEHRTPYVRPPQFGQVPAGIRIHENQETPGVASPAGRIPAPQHPRVNGVRGPAQHQQEFAVPNMPATQQPPSPSVPLSPQNQVPNTPRMPLPQHAVHWENVVPPPPPPAPAPAPGPGRMPVPSNEVSALDRKWGVLFDDNDLPTKRWDQVIRGIGNCLMNDFTPRNTLVITPGTMTAFYSQHRLELEVFPFTEIFRNRNGAPPARLAELYQQLACEYYLVPAEAAAPPTVPGLTPVGWTRWMTLLTRAYPDEEAQRLAKVVAALPINADSLLDGKTERLPKQISRRLLPEKADQQARHLLDCAIKTHLKATAQVPSTGFRRAAPAVVHQQPHEFDKRGSRYRPGSIPTPPPSQETDETDDETDDDRQRRGRSDRSDRENRNNNTRTTPHESNHSAPRDPAPSTPPSPKPQIKPLPVQRHSTSASSTPIPRIRPSSLSSRPPISKQNRHSFVSVTDSRSRDSRDEESVKDYHRESGEGRQRRGPPERGYTWPRSSSDSVYIPSRSGDRRDMDRTERERDRDGGKDRRRYIPNRRERGEEDNDRAKYVRDREYGRRDTDRDRDREREKDRERERERQREREARLRAREREDREKDRERDRDKDRGRDRVEGRGERRRSASVAGFPDRRTNGEGLRKPPVVVRDDRRAMPPRSQTWGDFLDRK